MKKLLVALVVFVPGLVSAQAQGSGITDVGSIFEWIVDFVNLAIPTIVGLAVLVFIWGVFRYVVSSDEEAKGKGKNMMIWGIVGLFVMVSVWGLVNILVNTFQLDTAAPDDLPALQIE